MPEFRLYKGAEKMKFAAAGDILITKRIPESNAGVKEVSEFIKRADLGVANLETTITDYSCFPSAYSGGTWLTADKGCLRDVRRYGFDFLGTANNHIMDYSYDGLFMTLSALDDEGIYHAGAGKNLYEASRPVTIETDNGRAGIIDICSTFEKAAMAGEQTARQPGRPGLNPLRFSEYYRISPEHAVKLNEIAGATKINCLREKHREQGFVDPPAPGRIEFGKEQFEISDGMEGRFSKCFPGDVERTVQGIKEALYTCEEVIVMFHSHEIKADEEWQADYFAEEFAHKCIDAGACAVIGSGTHQIKGIEIYKGCPVFYGLGNFIFENEFVRCLPADYMEKYGIDINSSGAYGIEVRSMRAKKSLYDTKEVYRTIVPYFEITDHRCTAIELLPLTLGTDRKRYEKNLPYPASEEEAHEILDYINIACECYNVKWKYENGVFRLNDGERLFF